MTTYFATDVEVKQEWAKAYREERSLYEWDQPVPAFGLSQWKFDSVVDILRLGKLRNDWDSYGSPPPSKDVLDMAIDLVRSIPYDDLPKPHVVPVSEGGIQLEWHISQREIEICILPDRTVEFLRIDRGEPRDEGRIETPSQVISLLAWLQA